MLDAGALMALERNERDMWVRLLATADAGGSVVVPAVPRRGGPVVRDCAAATP